MRKFQLCLTVCAVLFIILSCESAYSAGCCQDKQTSCKEILAGLSTDTARVDPNEKWIIYDARNPKAPTFCSTLAWVKEDNVVSLMILNSNPFAYSYVVEVTEEDAPVRELMHVYGAPITELMFPLQAAQNDAKEADKKLDETKKPKREEATAKMMTALSEISKAGEPLRQNGIERILKDLGKLSDSEINEYKTNRTRLLETDSIRRYFKTIALQKEELAKLKTQLASVASGLQTFEITARGAGDRLVLLDKPEDWEAELRNLLNDPDSGYEAIDGNIRDLTKSVLEFQAGFAGTSKEIDELLESRRKLVEVELKVFSRVPDQPASSEAARIIEAEKTAFSDVQAQLLDLKSEKDAFEKGLEELAKSLKTLREDLTDVLKAWRGLQEAIQNAQVTLSLGMFDEGKRITVKVTQEKIQEPKKPEEPDKKIVVIGSALKVNETETKVEISGKVSDFNYTKSTPAAPTSENIPASTLSTPDTPDDAGGEGENGTAGADGSKPAPAPKPKVVSLRETHFDVVRSYHVRINLGFAVSDVDKPTFDFRSEPVNDKTKQITIFIKENDNRQILPVVSLSLYLWPRYFNSLDGYRRYVPYPSFGLSLTDPTDNYFIGGGIDIASGVGLFAGAHFSKVDRLIKPYDDNSPFEISADQEFKIDDALEKSFQTGFYFSLSIDSGTLRKIFAGSGDNSK